MAKFPQISRRLQDEMPLLSQLGKNVSWIAKYFPWAQDCAKALAGKVKTART